MLKEIRDAILVYFQGSAAKAALANIIKYLIKKFFKGASFGGIKGWLIKVFVKEILIDEAIEPLIKKSFLEIGYGYNLIKGSILINKLDEARSKHDQDEYDRTIDDIIS